MAVIPWPTFIACALTLTILLWIFVGTENYSVVLPKTTFPQTAIPNNVHYIYLLAEPSSDFSFQFKEFLSIYSASIYFKPDVIYFHTDASEDSIKRAREDPNNKWNRLIFNMPRLRMNRVIAPSGTIGSKMKIQGLEHKSDFLRTAVMHKLGGIYLDWDAIPLRDVKVLRNSGFSNIVGKDRSDFGGVQGGTFLSKRRTELVRSWMERQHIVYDGGWLTHGNELLTKIATRLVRIPGEVLILESNAFTPGTMSINNRKMFEPHYDVPASSLNDKIEEEENSARWDNPEAYPAWEIDYSSTYVLHAFAAKRGNVANGEPIYAPFSPQEILARQSNFARATYPAVRQMLDAGIISADDLDVA